MPVVYDVIGLGFGPANLAIAGALLEKWDFKNSSPPRNALFIEQHSHFKWHPGMLLPNARMQISFLKDLATLRSPRSPLSFLSYLHSQSPTRLVAFINRASLIPTRKEYSDYLAWAASYVEAHGIQVRYGSQVVALNRGPDDASIAVKCRNVTSGEELTYLARDIIISPGGSPFIPEPFYVISKQPEPLAIHSSTYIYSIDALLRRAATAATTRPLRIAVIGSGQSAAEVTLDLVDRLNAIALPSGSTPGGRHQIDTIIRKGSLKPSDDSPFSNEIFDPAATDEWYAAPSDARQGRLVEFKDTNYGVVNPRTIEALHEILYDQQVDDGIARRTGSKTGISARPRITIRPYTVILSASTSNTSNIHLVLQNTTTKSLSTHTYDAIICATGYERNSWVSLLRQSSLGKEFGLTSSGPDAKLVPYREYGHENTGSASPPPDTVYISRRYRLLPVSELRSGAKGGSGPRIYLQGVEEATHGLSDTLLSVLGVRAGEVVEDLCGCSDTRAKL